MLVLSRQIDEKIIIGDSIVITVVEIRRGLVRLGIDAPRDVPVHREEVYNAIRAVEAAEAEAAEAEAAEAEAAQKEAPEPPAQPQQNHNDADAG